MMYRKFNKSSQHNTKVVESSLCSGNFTFWLLMVHIVILIPPFHGYKQEGVE
jgi:hypothetical protein